MSQLQSNKNNNQDDDAQTKNVVQKLEEAIKDKLDSILPPKIIDLFNLILSKLTSALPTLRTAFAAFITGVVITAAAIIVPIYNSVDQMTEPVALFETILTDLDRGYVDKVDTKKLFETGVSAMLRSLDPYTEFEGKQQAVELNESIGGKYGGIGLVISGPVLPPGEDSSSGVSPAFRTGNSITDDDDAATDVSSGTQSSPKNVLDESARMFDLEDALLNNDDDRYTYQDQYDSKRSIKSKDRKKALQKAKDRGIRVVSAFEGYAFDYGMRTGDKIVAVDGVPVTFDMSVDKVRNRLRGEPGSQVSITFERDGVPGQNTVTIPRTLVQLRDVKAVTFVGKPEDRIGYIQLTGFSGKDIAKHFMVRCSAIK